MTNEVLTHVSLISIEYAILRETYFQDLIADSAQLKDRKVSSSQPVTYE